MCDCGEDVDPYRAAIVTARVTRPCYECGRAIAIGDRFELVFGIFEGYSPFICATCLHCQAARQTIIATTGCACFYHGNLFDELLTTADEWWNWHREPAVGDRFRLVRLRVLYDRDWNAERYRRFDADGKRNPFVWPLPAPTEFVPVPVVPILKRNPKR